jgi:hypothetical protein
MTDTIGETGKDAEKHFDYFEAAITGRKRFKHRAPSKEYRGLFAAKELRDASIAHKVNTLLDTCDKDDTILVVCDTLFMAYGYGVPVRVWAKHANLVDDTYMIYAREQDKRLPLNDTDKRVRKQLKALFGEAESPADLCFVCKANEYADGGSKGKV